MSKILSGVFDIIHMLATVACFFIIEKVGRRPLAIWGGFATAATYMILAVLSALYSNNWADHTATGWACVATAFLSIWIYGLSCSSLGWVLPSEVFSSTASRSRGVALSVCTMWLADCVVRVSVPSMLVGIGYGTYVFFAVVCFLAGVWALFCVPETRGRSLEGMDDLFGGASGQQEGRHGELVRIAEAVRFPRNAVKDCV